MVSYERDPKEQSMRRRLAAPLASLAWVGSADHLDPDILAKHAAGELTTPQSLAVTKHLAVCDDGRCSALVREDVAGADAARAALMAVEPSAEQAAGGAGQPRGRAPLGSAPPFSGAPQDPSDPRTVRTFQCLDELWTVFEQYAIESGVAVDQLINESMTQHARQRSHSPRSPMGSSAGAQPAPRQGEGLRSTPPPPPQAAHPPAHAPLPPPYVPPPQAAPPFAAPPSPSAYGAPPPARAMPPAFSQDRGSPGSVPLSAIPLTPPPVGPPRHPRLPPLPPLPSSAAMRASQSALVPPALGPPARTPPPPPPGPAIRTATPLPETRKADRPAPPPMGAPPPPPGGGYLGAGAAPPLMGFSASLGAPTPAPGQALLVSFSGERFAVDKDRFIIGRGKQSCDLTIPDPNVSRQHAVVEFVNGHYYMVDMGSTNGVEFHGQRIARKQIAPGDRFRICDHELIFTYR